MSSADAFRMDRFTTMTHSKPSPKMDPSKAKLPSPYVVCILGASRGIGEGIVLAYAQAGASGLILASRSLPMLEEVAAKARDINPAAQVVPLECDLSRAEAVSRLASAIKSDFGRLDVVIVNSGMSGPVTLRLTEGDPEVFQDVIDLNYVGTYHAAHYLVPLLLDSPAGAKAFLAVGSIAAAIVQGPIANAQYCVSKLAQAKLVEHVHEQFKAEGLLALGLHPGAVATKTAESAPEVFRKYLIDDPNLCGAFCVWLTKERGKYDWLGGRLISANWEVDELVAKKDEIIEKDLLKFRISL